MTTQTADTLPTVGVWNIDPLHSIMQFSVLHHAVASFRGGFYPITGSFDAESGILSGQVRIADLHLPIEALREHLKTPAYFDADVYPTITFASRTLEAHGQRLLLEGDLTMKGVTRSIAATGVTRGYTPVLHQNGVQSDHLGIDLAAEIDRRDFGLVVNNELPLGRLNLGWIVTLEVALELIRATDG